MKFTERVAIVVAAAALMAAPAAEAAGVALSGAKAVSIDAPAASGLARLWVCETMQGATLTYTPSQPGAQVEWSRFSTLGGGYAEPLTPTTSYTLDNPQGDMGYIIDEGTQRTCVWLIDYSAKPFTARSLSLSNERDCGAELLIFDGTAAPLTYHAINGREMTVSREITVSYTTQDFDNETFVYVNKPAEVELDAISGAEVRVAASLAPTSFTLTGDRFLKAWGRGMQTVETAVAEPYAVAAETRATMAENTAENLSGGSSEGGEGDTLGGSAPVDIEFEAAVTDGAVFKEWQVSRSNDFADIDLRDDHLTFAHTFDETGTFFARFVCDNEQGGCPFEGQVYTITVGSSSLQCPNAFSPGASEGVNDEWRVSYRSIVEFDCSIFSRSGLLMCKLTDPTQGWDGRYKGKLVPAGVYYYMIRARGADGKDYKLSGDINIVNFK